MNCRKHTFVTMVLAGLLGMPALWGEAASPKGKAPLPEAARTAAEGWSQKEAAKKGTAPVEGKTNQKNLSAPISNVPVKPPFKKAVREVNSSFSAASSSAKPLEMSTAMGRKRLWIF